MLRRQSLKLHGHRPGQRDAILIPSRRHRRGFGDHRQRRQRAGFERGRAGHHGQGVGRGGVNRVGLRRDWGVALGLRNPGGPRRRQGLRAADGGHDAELRGHAAVPRGQDGLELQGDLSRGRRASRAVEPARQRGGRGLKRAASGPGRKVPPRLDSDLETVQYEPIRSK